MFTKTRTVKTLGLLFAIAIILRIPVLTVFRPGWIVDPGTNSSLRTVEYSDNFRDIYRANDIMNRNILSMTTYVAVVLCVAVLASKIRAASKFRRSLTSQAARCDNGTTHHETDAVDKKSNIFQISTPSTGTITKTSERGREPEKMSAKDLQVIQSVTLICVIYIFSQLPYQVISTVRLIDPEFSDGGSREFLYGIAAHISNTLSFVNASINIFVHYNYNTKFREQFLLIFC
ncbi:hypothetical protein EGW08_014307 [Elysia chlorotica]|uniref:G-protein coupled receptors family 1 profile domain-containing protein n=1 Tax=Elysia chlorotica TaxID=188477 RepID=A0A433T8M6_ELYCH|nr:hypothetical protein EGW08_014307 [Elysia chlorotica]